MKNIPLSLIFILLFAGIADSQTFTETKRLRINTKEFSEMGPVFYDGKLYFCSSRKTSLTKTSIDDEKPLYFYNIFEVSDTSLSRQVEMPAPVNTIVNDGPLCFGNDSTMYISRNFTNEKKSKTIAKTGIFSHVKKDGVWGEAIAFEYNNPEYSTGHPALSPGGDYLFFTSNKPGGSGGFDIYWCKRENNKWSKPVNAGNNVNSASNEIFPFFHSSGNLYFSSDADSVTGFDIYSSLFENDIFGTVQKLKEPVNSNSNDFSFYCDLSAENGYFASDRKGNDDIYRFRSSFPAFDVCDSMKISNFCYTFFEENSYEIDTTLMTYEWDFGDKKIRKEEADYCFPGPGAYDVSLNIIDLATGEIYQNQASYMMEIQEIIQPVISIPEKIISGQEIVFSAEKSNLPGYEVLGYYWRFSDEMKLSGLTTSRIFAKAGKQTVWLGVILKDIENNTTVKKCVFIDFVVD